MDGFWCSKIPRSYFFQLECANGPIPL